ncbi:MAG: hypothetical protein HY762_01470 [Planctomycetes bacterium]|nr:hypothetical protein [Planctomycetota bacterium]
MNTGPTTSYGAATAHQSLGSGSNDIDVFTNLTGLASNTTYNYRLVTQSYIMETSSTVITYGSNQTFTTYGQPIVATNSFGTTYGTNRTFTTGAPAPDGSNTWTEKISHWTGGSVPASRQSHSAVWDGTKYIMFGGFDGNATGMNNLWWYYPVTNTWIQKYTAVTPTARFGHTMVWDGTRVIMFGGIENGFFKNDLWWYNPTNNTWTEQNPTGGPPTARYNHSMVWDGANVIMFGGWSGSNRNDLWWYNPTDNTWTQKIANGDPSSPTARYFASMVWDSNRVILFGGYDATNKMNDLWWYDPTGNTWTQKIANGDINSPSQRYDGHSMAWDGTEAIMFGGKASDGNPLNDLWWYDPTGNTWAEKITQNGTGLPTLLRSAHSMVWDGTKGIMFGGYYNSTTYYNDLWWYEPISNTWTQKKTNGDAGSPAKRASFPMVWNGTEAIMFGGGETGTRSNELWWYTPSNNTWTQKKTEGDAGSPSQRFWSSMVWDGNKAILFGGDTAAGFKNDWWWYYPITNTWIDKTTTAISPSARVWGSMVWNGTKVILFGGKLADGTPKNDLWWYDPADNTWTEKIPNDAIGSPVGRWSPYMTVWDGAKVIMFGGNNAGTWYNDLWWYDPTGNTWTEKITNGAVSSPSTRESFSMIWDGARAIMFGGWNGSNFTNELWWYQP